MLAHYLDMAAERVRLPVDLRFDFRSLERVAMSDCGTVHAGLVQASSVRAPSRTSRRCFPARPQLAGNLDHAVVRGAVVRVVLGRLAVRRTAV